MQVAWLSGLCQGSVYRSRILGLYAVLLRLVLQSPWHLRASRQCTECIALGLRRLVVGFKQ